MPDTESRALRCYRSAIAGVVPLDRDVERRLARRWRRGDERAGGAIVKACLPFVMAIAFEYRLWGVPLEDLVQQGNLGLLKAASKFDLKKNCRLSTYAAYWIRAEIREYVVRGFRIVRVGTTKGERRALRFFRATGESDAGELARVSGLTLERAERLLPLLGAREASLDGASPDFGPRIDAVPSSHASPEDEAGAHQAHDLARDAVRDALQELSDRERLIVRERLMADEPTTLAALGARLGVSKERVRQIEERMHHKLRARLKEVRHLAA
jgi:RNA polymerase sigma-32 factor